MTKSVPPIANDHSQTRESSHPDARRAPDLVACSVVHDANNVLIPMLFAARLMADLGPQAADLAEQITNGCLHLRTMFHDFLSSQQIPPRPIDINRTVSSLAPLLKSLAGHAIAITIRFEELLPPARILPNSLERILMNLVANCREAARQEKGQITITTSLVLISSHNLVDIPPGSWVLVEVEDRGEGMDEATLARAAEAFFTTKDDASGVGLGLSSTVRLVRQANGHLRIESMKGIGTRVRVFLEAVEQHAEAQAARER
jgi:signal transduction histidine kinase